MVEPPATVGLYNWAVRCNQPYQPPEAHLKQMVSISHCVHFTSFSSIKSRQCSEWTHSVY